MIWSILFGLNLSAQTKNGNSTVAVLEFQKTGAITNDDVQTLSNRFRTMLFQTKTFNVVERQKMKEILKEQEFILSDECSTNECAVQVGQLLGVEYMIAGDIGLIGDTYTIDLRMIDVNTGQLVQTHSKDYDGKIAGLLEIMKQIAQSFAQFQEHAFQSKSSKKTDVVTSAEKDENKTEKKAKTDTEPLKSKSRNLVLRFLIGTAVPSGKFKTEADPGSGSNVLFNVSYFLTKRFQPGIDLGLQTFNKDGFKEEFSSFFICGRYYTFIGKFKHYLTLGLGKTKIKFTGFSKSYNSSKFGTGVSYSFFKNLSGEASLDFTNVGTKSEFDYDKSFTQFGFGINYNLAF
jgi:TolB-like protein